MRMILLLTIITITLTSCAPQAVYQIKNDKYDGKYDTVYMEQNYLKGKDLSSSLQFNLMKTDIPENDGVMIRIYTTSLRYNLEYGQNAYLVLNGDTTKRIWFKTLKNPENPGKVFFSEGSTKDPAMRMIAYYNISKDTINKLLDSEKAEFCVLQNDPETPGREFRCFEFTDSNREVMQKFMNEFLK